ncbi:MAG: hypothetical protein R3B81_18230 [bacterium]
MARRLITALSLFGLLGLVVALSGCPLSFDKQAGENTNPITFFDSTPADTTFRNEAFFRWIGTDLDSDVVAYQYQLVETDEAFFESGGQAGTVIRSLDPPGGPDDNWTPRQTDQFTTFSDLDDGWYEMRARSIDSEGAFSETARFRFYVFFDDVPPVPVIGDYDEFGEIDQMCGRIGQTTSYVFFINASDDSRLQTTPRTAIEYSYELRGRSQNTCTSHLSDGFTDWTYFPSGSDPLIVGNAPPTQYSDLFDSQCLWDFTLRARDPAGNIGTVSCCITREGSCN